MMMCYSGPRVTSTNINTSRAEKHPHIVCGPQQQKDITRERQREFSLSHIRFIYKMHTRCGANNAPEKGFALRRLPALYSWHWQIDVRIPHAPNNHNNASGLTLPRVCIYFSCLLLEAALFALCLMFQSKLACVFCARHIRVYDEKYLLFGIVQCTGMKESFAPRRIEKETSAHWCLFS